MSRGGAQEASGPSSQPAGFQRQSRKCGSFRVAGVMSGCWQRRSYIEVVPAFCAPMIQKCGNWTCFAAAIGNGGALGSAARVSMVALALTLALAATTAATAATDAAADGHQRTSLCTHRLCTHRLCTHRRAEGQWKCLTLCGSSSHQPWVSMGQQAPSAGPPGQAFAHRIGRQVCQSFRSAEDFRNDYRLECS